MCMLYVLCRATSATSHVVLGQFKTCVIMLGGYLIFDSDPGYISICGAFAALFGMSVYTSQNLHESGESLCKQLPKQNLPSPRPKTNAEESLESDVKDATNVV
jgi:hypothetical protein